MEIHYSNIKKQNNTTREHYIMLHLLLHSSGVSSHLLVTMKLIHVVLLQGKEWDHKWRSNNGAIYWQRVSRSIHGNGRGRGLLSEDRGSQDGQHQHLHEEEGPGDANLRHWWYFD